LAPPWPEIYGTDPERRHSFDVAVAEYPRLIAAYSALGYELIVLPKVAVAERRTFVLSTLAA
jgi:predicted ATPase